MREGETDWTLLVTAGACSHAMGAWVFHRDKAVALLGLVNEALAKPPREAA